LSRSCTGEPGIDVPPSIRLRHSNWVNAMAFLPIAGALDGGTSVVSGFGDPWKALLRVIQIASSYFNSLPSMKVCRFYSLIILKTNERAGC
jgi:hypothetical protein